MVIVFFFVNALNMWLEDFVYSMTKDFLLH